MLSGKVISMMGASGSSHRSKVIRTLMADVYEAGEKHQCKRLDIMRGERRKTIINSTVLAENV